MNKRIKLVYIVIYLILLGILAYTFFMEPDMSKDTVRLIAVLSITVTTILQSYSFKKAEKSYKI
ncbi:hypothetical protein [Terrisporobacter petrolearius]|uniref:hypothetical protein n=1 Tax=Terrisporobacter petrolearius TaxID=1460447 RepID=UPI003B000355